MNLGIQLLNDFKQLISQKSFELRHKVSENDFTRQRKLGFTLVFGIILKLVKKSLSIECEWLESDPKMIPPSKQAFSKARYKIKHTGFEELLDHSLKVLYQKPDYGTWRGYRVIAADGSSLRLPDSLEIVETFGRFETVITNGNMPPLGRVSLFVDLCTSMVCSARLAPWNVGEQTLAQEQLPEVVQKMRLLQQDKLLFIYDRGYPSINFIKQHRDLKADFVFRLQAGTYAALWKKVKAGEIDFQHILDMGKENLLIRVVVLTLANGIQEVLATSLLNKQDFSQESLGRIYCLRWKIEECYKRLKATTEWANFSGTHLEAVLQEFWAHLVMCNVMAVHFCDAQGSWNPDEIPAYRLNFSVLFGTLRRQLFLVVTGQIEPEFFQALFNRVAQRAKVKIRPGRLYSRDQFKKPKRHHAFRRVC